MTSRMAHRLVGAAMEEDVFVVDTSMISDDDGLGNFSIARQPAQNRLAFPEVAGEVLPLSQRRRLFYRAVVSYMDGHGTKKLLVTSPSETVRNVDDPVQGEVLITGKATEGETILVSTNGVSDEDGIASMSIGWEASTDGRNWRAIETGGSPAAIIPPWSTAICARVAVVDSFGVETVIFSQATNTVKNINNKPAARSLSGALAGNSTGINGNRYKFTFWLERGPLRASFCAICFSAVTVFFFSAILKRPPSCGMRHKLMHRR